MPAPSAAYRRAIRVLSIALVVIGIALVVRTLAAGGGAGAMGVALGVLFAVAGAGRLYLLGRQRP